MGRSSPFQLGAILALALACRVLGQDDASTLFSFVPAEGGRNGLKLAGVGVAPNILVSGDDFSGVQRAANDLAIDFGRVLGTNASVSKTDTPPEGGSDPAIIVGTAGKSPLVKALVNSGQVDVTEIEGKWEAYTSQLIKNESGATVALAIIGSDLLGTSFGVYDVSEQIGVSPWHWWADVPSKKRDFIFAPTKSKVQGSPSVKFRGIFFNDEAPALTNWAKAKFPSSQYGNPFTSQFYARVFDLLLRMKGNYLWPAMWSGMFYVDDAKNGPMAADYGIYMGTSITSPWPGQTRSKAGSARALGTGPGTRRT